MPKQEEPNSVNEFIETFQEPKTDNIIPLAEYSQKLREKSTNKVTS